MAAVRSGSMCSTGIVGGAKHRVCGFKVWARLAPTKLAAAVVRGALALALISLISLFSVRIVQAKGPKETVLYSFCPVVSYCTAGGGLLSPLTSDGAGNLYGTTSYGGVFGGGTVFELSPNSKGGWTESNLYNFCSLSNCADGGGPQYAGVIFDKAGNLYGTTYGGGANGDGTVFELSPAGNSWAETVLYSFTGRADGANPETGLIMDSKGTLYGATSPGYARATVFELSRSASGWKKKVISKIATYYAGLTMDAAGNIFGIGYVRGKSIVFELSPKGGGWTLTVLHKFSEAGANPQGTLVLDHAGNLYGTTFNGGAKNDGAVYRLSSDNGGKWTEKVLFSFNARDPKRGNNPSGGVVLDAAGNIYGTTAYGGDTQTSQGIVFELIAPVGEGSYEERVLCDFSGSNGLFPIASLIRDRAGKLYGTTYMGGSYDSGVTFEVIP